MHNVRLTRRGRFVAQAAAVTLGILVFLLVMGVVGWIETGGN